MRRSRIFFHFCWLSFVFFWLIIYSFYQVFDHFSVSKLKLLIHRQPELNDPFYQADDNLIKVICDPICFFEADGKQIRSRTDTDAATGLDQVKLQFYDAYSGLIGYQDQKPHPNFFVINTQSELIQVIRLKLDKISFQFKAYYPSLDLIQFSGSDGREYFYAANKPELRIL